MSELIELDLPSLDYIVLGELALCGRSNDESCSLTMRSIMKHSFRVILRLACVKRYKEYSRREFRSSSFSDIEK